METNLGPEYCITVTIPSWRVHDLLCQYWEGQWDPLYAVLSRVNKRNVSGLSGAGLRFSRTAQSVLASADEVARLREASERAMSDSGSCSDESPAGLETGGADGQFARFIDALDEAVDASARAEVEGELYGAGIIEDPDVDGGLFG